MEFSEAEQIVLAATNRLHVDDALNWIREGRRLSDQCSIQQVLASLLTLEEGEWGVLADEALQVLTRVAVTSEMDPSAELLGLDRVLPPTLYQEVLDRLADHSPGGTLAHLHEAAVAAVQSENGHTIDVLCAVAGLSYRDLVDRAQPHRLPSRSDASWNADQISAAFSVIDPVIQGEQPSRLAGGTAARPVEFIFPSSGTPDGWAAVEAMRTGGVSYGMFLTQRAVGSAWGAHRNSTATLLPQIILDEIESHVASSGLEVWRLGTKPPCVSKTFLAERISVGGEIGQVQLVIRNDQDPLIAVAVSVGRDGGTSRKSGGKLVTLPSLLEVPAALVLVGAGWAERGESSALVKPFGGRIFTERTLGDLMRLPEIVSAPLHTAPRHN